MIPCEPEIIKFLKEQELPTSEVPLAYREEDCAYLTIKTIEELQEKIVQVTNSFDEEIEYLEVELNSLEDRYSDLVETLTLMQSDLEDEIDDLNGQIGGS